MTPRNISPRRAKLPRHDAISESRHTPESARCPTFSLVEMQL
jgi:hypothetical protein